VSRPTRIREDRLPASTTADRRDAVLFCGIFIESNEVAERYGEAGIFVVAERVHAQRILEPGNNDGEAQRIQARIEQGKIIRKKREATVLLLGNLLELLDDYRSYIHALYLPSKTQPRSAGAPDDFL
jgi:hypothetical protein